METQLWMEFVLTYISWRAFHMFHLSSYQTNGLFTADWLVRSTLVVPKYLAYQAPPAKLAPLHPGSGAAGCIGALMVSIWSPWWPGTSGVQHGLPWPTMAHHPPLCSHGGHCNALSWSLTLAKALILSKNTARAVQANVNQETCKSSKWRSRGNE